MTESTDGESARSTNSTSGGGGPLTGRPARHLPVILAVDDEAAVLSRVARDLRAQYGDDYRIVRAESGAAALTTLRQLQLRRQAVALLLVDQRMPEMSGVEFLEEAIKLYSDAKRVLLTGYADKESAIRAINTVGLDHYLEKPWHPPEERLYPVLTDVLDDWQAAFRSPFEGITVVGHRWSAESHRVKDFLVRNLVPYRWLDVDLEEEARTLVEVAQAGPADLPLVLFPDGDPLVRPDSIQLATRLGLRTRAELPMYDLVIVGGGPAGLASAVYGASEGLTTLLIEGQAPGGQAGTSSRIENYLGFPVGLSGGDLTRRAVAQASRFGAEILTPSEAEGVRLEGPYRFVQLTDGSEVACRALLIATGVQYRKLDAPGIDRLTGAGVYYGAAMTEAIEAKDRDAFIVGGGNSAGQAAMYLSKFARSVTILVRGESLAASMSHYLVAQLDSTPNVHHRYTVAVTGVDGQEHLEMICLTDLKTGEVTQVPADALFIFIGAMPRTDWVNDVVERDRYGFILTGSDVLHDGKRPRGWTEVRDPFWLESSVPGIFVAGDVRHESVKRVASAVGEGAMAVQFIHRHLASLGS